MESLANLLQQDDIEAALVLFSRMPAQPEDSTLLLKHARTWHSKGWMLQQRHACEAVLAQDNTHFEAWHLLGVHAYFYGEFEAAEQCFITALSHRPDFSFSLLALSRVQMLRSRFREGRQLYEARFCAPAGGIDWRSLPIARWQGQSLTGKSIYLWEEQGLGLIILFASLLPFILQQAPARVTMGITSKLLPLFARSFPEIRMEPIAEISNHMFSVISLQIHPNRHLFAGQKFDFDTLEKAYNYTQTHGHTDFAAPMGDLLVHALPGFTPEASRYLVADPALRLKWETCLRAQAQGKRLIGISWYTSNIHETLRNIPLDAWLPLLAQPDCMFVSLQHHVTPETVQDFCRTHGCAIWQDAQDDPTQTPEELAALIACLDHVVTIDNTNVHLAGALGVPTSVLLPKGYNYQWPLLENARTLWYPSVTTVRQETLGMWEDVIRSTITHLAKENLAPMPINSI